MKRNKILVYILHRLFTGLLVIVSLLFLVNIGFELFTDNGKVGSFSAGSHHSKGYYIPVKMQTRVYDPIFTNEISLNIKEHTNENGMKWRSSNPEYVDKLPDDINVGTKNILSFHFDNDMEYFKTNDDSFIYDGFIVAKSDNPIIILVQILKAYSGIFSLIIMLFFMERIFYSLNKSLTFTHNLNKKVKYLGIVFIFSESLSLLFSYVLGSYYGRISTQTLIDGKRLSGGLDLSMNPRLEFDFAFFLIGLSLLVLASLLKSGSQLQQENELTI
mgnify:CR=1 FL=1